MSELPSGWAETKFSEILGHHSGNSKLIKGKLHSSPSEGRYQGFSASGADVWLDHYEQEGTAIIISAVGARCGKCFLAKGKWTAIANTHVVKPASGELNAKFFWYLLNNEEFWVKGGSGQPFVKTKASFDRPFLLPPSFEQRRIVEKIEQLFDLLDKGEESLRAARDKAGLYRQSLLKHAFEGHLTADWRAANPDKLEDPETLLTRIQEERDARYKQALDDWQTALTKWRADGEEGKKPAKPKRPPATERVDPPDNYHTCESWIWVSVLSLLRAPLINGRSVKDRADGFPVLRLTALKGEKLDLSEYKNGAWNRSEALPYLVEEGDFYVARGNGSKKLVGLGSLASNVTFETAFPDTMIRLRLDLGVVASGYFGRVWNSRILRDQIEEAARTTAGIYKINQDHISGFVFPLCSPAEQAEIVSRLEAKLSTLDALEADIDRQLARSRALRQSILKRAFEGKLVPQDPTDEPASALLARIKAERDAAPKPKRKRKTPA
ncbi:restriction endonuclease subunit S [Sedimentitalea nanhaiensis]|uniref:Type I restriction enzyme, S subunit n=1 Tax=Sedimentitalea nanhaiensis TaxID=999627 RepID=A0A1I7B0K2_9RHOB|nr:restriction endonuclease subunit S [Sedimentitalea nanhaiensis]SFT80614.1 type I restriction enzyme, S subunit [Sedimentitalea nanhaiensis]